MPPLKIKQCHLLIVDSKDCLWRPAIDSPVLVRCEDQLYVRPGSVLGVLDGGYAVYAVGQGYCSPVRLLSRRQRIRRSLQVQMSLGLISTSVKIHIPNTYQVVTHLPKSAPRPSVSQIEYELYFLSEKHGEQA
jgi:hypothetical protein